MEELVSIIIPLYNQGELIEETLSSIKVQTYTNYEVIIVDDGSDEPKTIDKINDLIESGYTVLKKSNGGLSSARNYGIENCNGQLVVCLDSDDIIHPDFLQQLLINIRKNPLNRISYSNGFFWEGRHGFWFLRRANLTRLARKNSIYCSAMFYRDDWLVVGGYDEELKKGWEDWDFWVAILSLGGCAVKARMPLFGYRIRKNSMSRIMTEEYKLFAAKKIFKRGGQAFIDIGVTPESIAANHIPFLGKISWRFFKWLDLVILKL
ncbi:TPA: glycosyltransferase family 2 protein [Aeromonas hydrophila]|nr:glycosyltransferase family 2 protein [Aeromonas hydrophila]HAT2496530.1 glycosyltransferase family 2 protein [Aeromonas hydrophila]HAT2511887.1 glycosyltransferase family 2 protein [Aeromonas hydrophila]HAT2532379.1 glycosyltransferase family 2 protein [Aeromonas hydrophila]